MSGPAGQFVIDTLVYSGLLIVLVLALRGLVARWCGPQVAYALWALPLIRLFLPPLTLPASMGPASMAPPVPLAAPADPMPLLAQEFAAVTPAYQAGGIAWAEALAAVWLAGAAVFLVWRVQQYRAMRRSYLAEARPVGEVGQSGRGRVRLVETPAAALPLAFGIADKVVALPPGFMALHDRTARDLAIAHELAHHRGHDLAANLAAQVLLALHWFNPVAWIGWRAMRKDQEAACDARVLAGRERAERTRYAEVIAGFAAGRRLSLAAPLACPMLGEKSIIHRLRSLTMSETSLTSRRIGLGAIVAAALALPLTASITYAQPEPPTAPRMERRMVIVDVPEGSAMDDPALHSQNVVLDDGTAVILRTAAPVSPEEARARVDRAIASMPVPPEAPAAPEAPLPPLPPLPPEAAPGQPHVRQFVLRHEPGSEHLAPDAPQPPAPGQQRSERRIVMLAPGTDAHRVEVTTRCDGEDGQECTVNIVARSLAALERAREAIAESPMPDEARAEALREIDREIARMREGAEVSARDAPLPRKPGAQVAEVAWRMATGSRKAAASIRRSALRLAPSRLAKDCPEGGRGRIA